MGKINYTDEMVARLHAVYIPESSEEDRIAAVKLLSVEFAAPQASVIGKLTTEQLYVPKAKIVKEKKAVEPTRQELVDSISDILGVALHSLVRAKKADLEVLLYTVEAQ